MRAKTFNAGANAAFTSIRAYLRRALAENRLVEPVAMLAWMKGARKRYNARPGGRGK